MLDDDTDQDDVSRGDELLAELKRKRVVPGQFRVATLLLAIVAVSILLATPRFVGWEYPGFFGFLWIAAFALAPLIALIVTAFVPWLRPRNRILLAVACIVLAIAPVLATVAWADGAAELVKGLIFTSVWFWLPQIICIWGVWFFLFRRARR